MHACVCQRDLGLAFGESLSHNVLKGLFVTLRPGEIADIVSLLREAALRAPARVLACGKGRALPGKIVIF
jgi:hypothetical protein